MSLPLRDLSLCDLGVCLHAKDTVRTALRTKAIASIKPLYVTRFPRFCCSLGKATSPRRHNVPRSRTISRLRR